MRPAGYGSCACRDCFDMVFGAPGEETMCGKCKRAGCILPANLDSVGCREYSCRRKDAYGRGEGEG